MLNHFRTLLLNESFFEAKEHIPVGFSAKVYPSDIAEVFHKLFPPACSKLYKNFLVQVYLNIINSAGIESATLLLTRASLKFQERLILKLVTRLLASIYYLLLRLLLLMITISIHSLSRNTQIQTK